MTALEQQCSDRIIAAMRAAGAYEAAVAGTDTPIRFVVKVPGLTGSVDCEVSLGCEATLEQRQQEVHACYQAALKMMLDARAMEMLKIARCPKCSAWFPSTGERNEHRTACRYAAKVAEFRARRDAKAAAEARETARGVTPEGTWPARASERLIGVRQRDGVEFVAEIPTGAQVAQMPDGSLVVAHQHYPPMQIKDGAVTVMKPRSAP